MVLDSTKKALSLGLDFGSLWMCVQRPTGHVKHTFHIRFHSQYPMSVLSLLTPYAISCFPFPCDCYYRHSLSLSLSPSLLQSFCTERRHNTLIEYPTKT